MADNTQKRSDFLTDSFTPKSKDGAGDPLAELARLIGQSDPFTEAARKPLDVPRATERPAAPGSAERPAPGSAERPAPEWLARPAPSHGDEQDYEPRPAARDSYPHEQAGQQDHYPPGDYAAHGEEPAAYAPEPSQSYRPLASVFAADGAQSQRLQAAAPAQDAQYDGHYQDGYESDAHQGDDRYRVAPPSPAGDYEADTYYSEDGHMPPQGDEGHGSGRNRARSGLITVAAVVGLAVVGTAGAFGYRAYTTGSIGPGNPPVIKADTTPAKIVATPVATTTTTDAAGKPIQDRIAAPPASGSRLESREEQPMAIPTAPPRSVAPPVQAMAPQQAAPASAGPTGDQPKRVKTISIPRDPDAAATTSSAPAPSVARTAPTKQQGQQSGAAPMQLAPQADPPATKTKSASRTTQAVPSGIVAQVTARKTEADAQADYRSLQQKFPNVLGSREARIVRADLGQTGIWYRAQIGPFPTNDQANAFCDSLKAAGGPCMVTRN
jgi:hypothetical protein